MLPRIGLRQRVTFGGQAAMSPEWFVDTTVLDAYPIDLAPHTRPGEAAILDWRPLVATVLGDLRRGVDRGVIAARIGGLRVVDMLSGEQLPRICSVSELRTAGWHAVWRISRVEGLEPTSNTIGGTARSLHLLHP